jgi:hypothetical protein
MHYVCIENNEVIGIQNYEPAVPSTVSVTKITDEQYKQITDQTHGFDVVTKTVIPMDTAIFAQKEQDKLNAVEREFLNSTDWKILRHLRQKVLDLNTSLTQEQYLELEQQRQAAAARIV